MDADENTSGPSLIPLAGFTLVVLALLALIAIPNFVGRGPGRFNGILNNLRLIDGAKAQWADEHHISDTSQVPAENDLIPFLGRDQSFVRPICGEKYVINSLSQPSEAILTKKIKESSLPAGTIIRFDTNGAIECIPPGQQNPGIR